MINSIKKAVAKGRNSLRKVTRVYGQLLDIRDILIATTGDLARAQSQNPLTSFGVKCFSQSDEDGITLEIVRRLGMEPKNAVFAELGVGNGTENNTLILASLGWKGFWLGGEDLVFDYNKQKKRFLYKKTWITLENVVHDMRECLTYLGEKQIDVVSLDLDGNDLYFVEAILKADLKPSVFIVEYNSKFPPPVEFTIKYDENHKWLGDDYFGASLASFANLFGRHGYFLACCNAQTGMNAFFIKNEYKGKFADVPDDINKIYVSPRYKVSASHGHSASLKTIQSIFN